MAPNPGSTVSLFRRLLSRSLLETTPTMMHSEKNVTDKIAVKRPIPLVALVPII